ncbi:MAG: prolyl oligopeptidase family serine peptidase [Candidatus Thermoplasmatota archaeon]|nr:prolyl oligopeptidase family serine peptidase [Candidatus Thermoplasmatota archaeon]
MKEIAKSRLEKLFSAQYVMSFDVDLSTGRIVYSVNTDDGRKLYLLDPGRDGKYSSSLLSDEDRSYVSLKLIGGGSRLIFLGDVGGDEKNDIFVSTIKPKDGKFVLGEVRNLTPDTDYSILPPVSVDETGRKVAFVSNREGEFAAFVMDVNSSKMSRITRHAFSDNAAVISPDGRYVAVSSSCEGEENCISVRKAEEEGRSAGKFLKVNEVTVDASSPCWAGDSKTLAFSSMHGDVERIGITDHNFNGIRWLTGEDENCSSPVFSGDGRFLSCLREGSVSLLPKIIDLNGSSVIDLADFIGGWCYRHNLSADGKQIFMLAEDTNNPTNMLLFDTSSKKGKWLTKSFSSPAITDGFVSPVEVRYLSEHDGLAIPALLYRAEPDTGTNAAVISIHGGPTWRSYDKWDPLIQSFVLSGISVICPNYRGSSGYGKKFRDANRFVMGSADLADCAGAWKYLTENGLASRNKIAVMGASFGGYLTMCSLVFYPDRWCAGSATVPFLNWFTEMESEREDLRYWDIQNMGDPVKDADRLRSASPVFFLDRIRAPVQIIAGENDPRCPLSESLQAKEKIEKMHVPLDFKFYRDEGHSFEKMENIIDSQMRTYRFLRKHLLSDT